MTICTTLMIHIKPINFSLDRQAKKQNYNAQPHQDNNAYIGKVIICYIYICTPYRVISCFS